MTDILRTVLVGFSIKKAFFKKQRLGQGVVVKSLPAAGLNTSFAAESVTPRQLGVFFVDAAEQTPQTFKFLSRPLVSSHTPSLSSRQVRARKAALPEPSL